MKMNEVFDSSIENLKWQRRGRFELAKVSINDLEYVIQVEQKPLDVMELKKYNTAEVSFFLNVENDEQSHSTTGTAQRAAPSVYGVVLNALLDKFKEYDAFYFTLMGRHSSSLKEVEQKKRIYIFLAGEIAKRTPNTRVYDSRNNPEQEFLISKVLIQKDSRFGDIVKESISKLPLNTLER